VGFEDEGYFSNKDELPPTKLKPTKANFLADYTLRIGLQEAIRILYREIPPLD
jgi:hypothetical protein